MQQLLGRIAELEALVTQLETLVAEQAAVIARQAAEIERLRGGGGAGKTPQNSSLPPSAAVPPNRTPGAATQKRGPRRGHRGRSRFRCQPDRLLECRPQQCVRCGTDLTGTPAHVRGRSQQVELPVGQPLVVEVVRYRCTCPQCGASNTAAPPAGWDTHQRFGPRLQGLLAYLHHQHHVGYARLRQLLLDLFSLTISEGAIAASLARVAKRLEAPYQRLREQVRGSPVVGSDETRQRVVGQNCWSWVVQSTTAAYHWVGKRRATQELLDFYDGCFPEVQVSDCFSAQLAAPVAQKQVCMAHQLRDLTYAQERGDEAWAPKMARLIRCAITLAKRREQLGAALYDHQARRLQRLGHRLGWEVGVENAFGAALKERYQRLEEHWWVFLERADVEPTNNASERALRPVVVHRKVNGGFRSEWGAEGYARFVSVAQTAQKQGQPLFPTLLQLLAPHPFPLPE